MPAARHRAAALCVSVLTLLGVIATGVAWRRGNRGRVVQGVGLALAPVALYFTGLLRLLWDGVVAVGRLGRPRSSSPRRSGSGSRLLGLCVVLWVVGGIVARRTAGGARAVRAAATSRPPGSRRRAAATAASPAAKAAASGRPPPSRRRHGRDRGPAQVPRYRVEPSRSTARLPSQLGGCAACSAASARRPRSYRAWMPISCRFSASRSTSNGRPSAGVSSSSAQGSPRRSMILCTRAQGTCAERSPLRNRRPSASART